jgi:hypothetical protein
MKDVKREQFINSSPQKINVTLPASIAYDLKGFQKIQASILEKLGCAACTSGHDIRLNIERDFLVDVKGRISTRSY